MGINDFSELGGGDPAVSCVSTREHGANSQVYWHAADTGPFPQRSRPGEGWTYFAQRADGAIKIGMSERPRRRLNNHRRDYPGLKVLTVVRGAVAGEYETHQRFSHLRINDTEWFRPEPELLQFIEGIRDDNWATSIEPVPEPPIQEERSPWAVATEAVHALSKQRPDLKHICADLVANIEFQRKWPDDPDFKAAGARLYRNIERLTAANCQ